MVKGTFRPGRGTRMLRVAPRARNGFTKAPPCQIRSITPRPVHASPPARPTEKRRWSWGWRRSKSGAHHRAEDRGHRGVSRVRRTRGARDARGGRRRQRRAAGVPGRGALKTGQRDGDGQEQWPDIGHRRRQGAEQAQEALQAESGACRRSDQGAEEELRQPVAQRPFRGDAALQPQTEAVEGPGRRPAHERAEEQPVGDGAEAAPAGAVVVAGEEADAVAVGDVAPVAAALGEKGERVRGGEAQGRRCGCRRGVPAPPRRRPCRRR